MLAANRMARQRNAARQHIEERENGANNDQNDFIFIDSREPSVQLRRRWWSADRELTCVSEHRAYLKRIVVLLDAFFERETSTWHHAELLGELVRRSNGRIFFICRCRDDDDHAWLRDTAVRPHIVDKLGVDEHQVLYADTDIGPAHMARQLRVNAYFDSSLAPVAHLCQFCSTSMLCVHYDSDSNQYAVVQV
jgi:hypothetical protein